MVQTPEVVVTGWGVVSPIGIGRAAFTESLLAGRSGVGRVTRYDPRALASQIGGEVRGFEPKQYVRPIKSLKVMCRDIQLGVAAANLALDDAGLNLAELDSERRGVVIGAELMPCDPGELTSAYRACVDQGHFDFARWGTAGLSEFYPLWMLKYLPNMPACHVAIAHDCRGPNNTIALWEVSSLLALAEAAEVIRRGKADLMLAGGTCSRMNPTQAVRNGVWQLSSRNAEPETACRPFDRDRDGMVPGEGAAVFVLERADHATARRAKVQARWLAAASSFGLDRGDGEPHRRAIASGIRSVLARAGLTPADVGHVNAHGLGTSRQDALEASAIHDVLGEVPVTAPKSFFGNLGAGGGAVELAASLVGLAQGLVPVTLNYQSPDTHCPVSVVHGQPLAARSSVCLALNQNCTGQAVAALVAGP